MLVIVRNVLSKSFPSKIFQIPFQSYLYKAYFLKNECLKAIELPTLL